METRFALSEIDTTTPHPARMYDALLGGKDNCAADRQAVRQVLQAAPEVRDSARANRAFLQRAVRYLAGETGIGQIIDIGNGIPAAGNDFLPPQPSVSRIVQVTSANGRGR